MFGRIDKFIRDHDIEIAMAVCCTAGVLVGAWMVSSALRGTTTLSIPNAAAKDLLNGKDILVDCLDDAHLLIKYVPKI